MKLPKIKMSKKIVIPLVAGLVVLAGVTGAYFMKMGPFSGSSSSAAEQLASGQIQTTTVQKGTIRTEVTTTGNLAYAQAEDLVFQVPGAQSSTGAKMPGYVDKILIDEGDTVKKDQILAYLDKSDFERAVYSIKKTAIQAEISVINAQVALDAVKNPGTNTNAITGNIIPPDPADIRMRELQLELAEVSLHYAKKDLEENEELSPELRAPFDGFITSILVKGGDTVNKGTVAIKIVDPDKFESTLLINETDIAKIKVGSTGAASVDSIPGLTLPLRVTKIYPAATISGGVVSYRVLVELTTPRAGTSAPGASGQPRQGGAQLQQLLESAQAQDPAIAQRIRDRLAQLQQSGGQAGTSATTVELKGGLTITARILVEEKRDIVVLANRAIVRQSGSTYAQLIRGEIIEQVPIKIGISNTQNTEILEGLKEGDKVAIPQPRTTTTPTPTQQQPGGGMPRINIR